MELGIIQGRLSPPIEGFQETPSQWRREFALLKQHGLNHIEWVITKKSFETNPLFSKDFDKGNLPISSICADNLVDKRIFMRPFLEKNLTPICDAAIKHDIKFVTIPLLESSSLADGELRGFFKKGILSYAARYPGLNFSFEAEMPALSLLEILELSDNFYATYDTGNMTSMFVNHERYIDLIFHKINNVHLKDRTRQGGSRSLPPSEGDTNFELIFAKLKELGYNKLYTLQTARGPFGEEASTILRHRDILQEIYDGA
tara:strand:+ start:3884 stop:4660 length:777 start_codon:yes stop_codon:yes gene_type:complete